MVLTVWKVKGGKRNKAADSKKESPKISDKKSSSAIKRFIDRLLE